MATVQLDWDYIQGSDPAVRFRVERRVGAAGAFGLLTEVNYPTVTYSDTTAADGQTYGYRVAAINAVGIASTPTNIVTVSVPGILNAPTNLRGTLV